MLPLGSPTHQIFCRLKLGNNVKYDQKERQTCSLQLENRIKDPWGLYCQKKTCIKSFIPHDPWAYPSAEWYHAEWSEWLPVTWRRTQNKSFQHFQHNVKSPKYKQMNDIYYINHTYWENLWEELSKLEECNILCRNPPLTAKTEEKVKKINKSASYRTKVHNQQHTKAVKININRTHQQT